MITESVITLTTSTAMTRISFPSGAQLSMRELYASASILMCSDVPESLVLPPPIRDHL